MTPRIAVLHAAARVLAFTLLMGACTEPPFAHTNPLDPEFQGSYVLLGGTDTLSRTFLPFQMHVEGTPALSPEIRLSWESNHPRLHVDGSGLVYAEPTLRPAVGSITVTVGPHQAQRSFVMLQRAGSIVTTCMTLTPCDSVDAIGSQFAFAVGGTDLYEWPLLEIPFALNEDPSIVRDPSVLASLPAIEEGRRRFITLANGITWVTIDIGEFRDSVRVVVRQRATSWTNHCPATVGVGETVNLRARDFVDRNGHGLQVDVLGFPEVQWEPGRAVEAGASATVHPSGSITGNVAGAWLTGSFIPGFEGSIPCVVTVVDP